MDSNQSGGHDELTFIDVVAFLIRARFAVLLPSLIALILAIAFVLLLPVNKINSVYSRSESNRLLLNIDVTSPLVSTLIPITPADLMLAWQMDPSKIGKLVARIDPSLGIHPDDAPALFDLGQKLMNERRFVVSYLPEAHQILFEVNYRSAEMGTQILSELMDESYASAKLFLREQAQSAIAAMDQVLAAATKGNQIIDLKHVAEVKQQAMIYVQDNYGPFGALYNRLETTVVDRRVPFAAGFVFGVFFIAFAVYLIRLYVRRLRLEPGAMAKLAEAFGKTPKKTEEQP